MESRRKYTRLQTYSKVIDKSSDIHIPAESQSLPITSLTKPFPYSDDWLTSYYLSPPPPLQSDYRFTYLGPSQTFTPLHRDVYASYSWSTNILGRKRWWLIPPEVWDRERNRLEGCFDLRGLSGEVKGVWVVDQEVSEPVLGELAMMMYSDFTCFIDITAWRDHLYPFRVVSSSSQSRLCRSFMHFPSNQCINS